MKPFNIEKYKTKLNTSWLGADLIYKESTASTNLCLKRLDSQKISHGSVCLADYQTRGRGQYKRNWASEKNKNLMFTIAFKPSSGDRLPLLTLSCALGIARAIDEYNIEICEIKWPNDVLINGKKIAGILTESVFVGKIPERVLVGIGLNVNQLQFGNSVGAEATSLSLEVGEKVMDREELLCSVLQKIEHLYSRWQRYDPGLCQDINRRLIGYGEWVGVTLNGSLNGEKFKFLGMNEKGQCVMLNQDLNVHTFSYEQIRVFPDR